MNGGVARSTGPCTFATAEPNCGQPPEGVGLRGMVAVEHLDGVVVGLVADQRAHDDQLVHDPGQARKGLADLDAGDVGGDRPPRAGDFLGRVRLQIEHVLMRRPADQVDQDHRFLRRPHAGGRLGPQQLRQGESAERRGRRSGGNSAGTEDEGPGSGSGMTSRRRHRISPGKGERREGRAGWTSIAEVTLSKERIQPYIPKAPPRRERANNWAAPARG